MKEHSFNLIDRLVVIGVRCRYSAIALALLNVPASAQTLAITPNEPTGIYSTGEAVVWNLQISGDPTGSVTQVNYTVDRDGATRVAQGVLPLTNGAATLQAKLDTAGTLLATFTFKQPDGTVEKNLAGIVVDPYNIQPSASEPADFGSFWKLKIAELDAIPLNPILTPDTTVDSTLQYDKITLDNINGSKVWGQIARPAVGDKFPAVLVLQYAGVYGLPKTNVTNLAKRGWLALNISAHDLPIDQTPDFYATQSSGPLNNYTMIGNTSRETSYFLRMVLGCCRAVEYLKTRPDWDGKTLVATGTSQGGFQSLAVGGLEPSVTDVIVDVAAGCDNSAANVGRAVPWPYWSRYANNSAAIMETSRYYDAVNFARHIKVPTLMAVGLIDMTACAPGDIAAFNQIQNPSKTLIVMPRSDHKGTGGTQAPFNKESQLWLAALAAGNSVPPSQSSN